MTDAAGRFQIKNLPAGNYTLGIWHEGLSTLDGANETQIVVKADETVAFAMKKK